MQDYVKEVFEIAGFDSFLPIVPTLDDALGKLQP
jgi:anti-sigma B factor antagonist